MADDRPAGETSGPEERSPEERRPELPGIFDFFAMGVAIALCLIIGGGVGYAIDVAAGTEPIVTFVGLAFGIVSAVLVTISNVRKYL